MTSCRLANCSYLFSFFKIKLCQEIPNQNIRIIIEKKRIFSFEFKSSGIAEKILVDNPNIVFIQLRKKKTGPKKYNKITKIKNNNGNKSSKKLKNKNSAIKKIEPGKPKKIKQLIKHAKNNLGHMKFKPDISVNNRVLKRLLTASTNKNELVESKA